MCRFIESIKLVDGEFCRLEFHQERVNAVFQQFYSENEVFNLKEIIHLQTFPEQGIFKCRIVFDSRIQEIQILPYSIRTIRSLKLVEVSLNSSTYKSEERTGINAAFENRSNCDDVLMVVNGCITDTSYANVALFDSNQWFTPDSPVIFGTQRAALLQSGKIKTKRIPVTELSNFTKIRIFNAMIEFGEIELDVQKIEF